jgi:hypothetical protein
MQPLWSSSRVLYGKEEGRKGTKGGKGKITNEAADTAAGYLWNAE